MPSFPRARIWLESEGSRMKEYGEQTLEHEEAYSDEADRDLISKVVFIELIPEARFVLKYIYNVGHVTGDREWISLEVFSDGVPCDDFMVRKEPGNLKVAAASAGHRTGPATCIPYRFGACRFADSEGSKPNSALGRFEVILEAMKKVSRMDEQEESDFGWTVSRRDFEYDKDSKASSLGYSVQSSKGAVRPADFVNPTRYEFVLIPGMPRYKVTFLYRTRQFLVAHRFIDDLLDASPRQGGVTRSSEMAWQTSSSGSAPQDRQDVVSASEMERLRHQNDILRAELEALRSSMSPRREATREERPRAGRTGGQGRRIEPAPGQIVIDLTEENA